LIAAGAEIVVTGGVVGLRKVGAMSIAVDLDDDTRIAAGEIGVVGADLDLPTEVPALLAELVQELPHGALGR
jgi:hypothetical protein